MKTLYLLQFNNYYNRVVKKEDELNTYLEKVIAENKTYQVCAGRNYNPNDGITTGFTINLPADAPDEFTYDYMLVCDGDTIVSRWYVVEAVRQCLGQYAISCMRDVVADWYNDVIKATTFIEKAYIKSIADSAIYNAEDMTFNQIKTAIEPLKDETKCQWIVGYIPKNITDTTFSFDWSNAISAATEVSNLQSWSYYDQLNREYSTNVSKVEVWSSYSDGSDEQITCGILIRADQMPTFADMTQTRFYNQVIDDSSVPGVVKGKSPVIAPTGTISPSGYLLETGANIMLKALQTNYWPNIKSAGPSLIRPSINSQVGKYIKDISTGVIYKIIKQTSTADEYITISSGTSFEQLKAGFSSPNQWTSATISQPGPFRSKFTIEKAKYILQQVNTNITVDISNRIHTVDSPYDMFCMPYPENGKLWNYAFDNLDMFMPAELSMTVATSISAALGSQAVYDVQLLPYCPVRNLLNENGVVDSGGPYGSAIRVSETDEVIGHMFWATNSSDSFSIAGNMLGVENPIEFKVANQCDFYRLVSPTDGSMFEFSLTKNGPINKINVNFTYKPFSPYIKVAPEFGRLYGQTFDWDKRGLILRGDFSLPQTSNAWANYKLNNVNYENIFNRQIESMEFQNKYQKQSETINAITGAIGAGGTTGMLIGGKAGAVAGGIAGAFSLGAGLYDIYVNDKMRQETLDFTKDQFGYQLGNIQALPNSLTKVSAFDIDCSPWPIIEYYTCTDIEKNALRNKIIYNGMTVMRIGKIEDFQVINEKKYTKGKIIRFGEDFTEDTHVANVIAKEINMGVYI